MLKEMSVSDLAERKQKIINLVNIYYDKNPNLKKRKIDLNRLVDSFVNRFLYSDYSIEKIEETLISEIYTFNNVPVANMSRRNNEISENKDSKVKKLIRDLNQAHIDYVITGQAVASICNDKTIPDSTLSIYLNEGDFEKFKEICNNNGLNIVDRRNTPRRKMVNGNVIGDPNISISSDDSRINIDAMGFERLNDKSVVLKDNYNDSDGNHLIKADFYGKELAEEIFDSNVVSTGDCSYPIVSPEFEYINKVNSTNTKDIEIASKLKNCINSDKYDKIQNLALTNFTSQITVANPKKTQKNDLSSMLDDKPAESINSTVSGKEKPKQFIKTNNSGYVSKLAFIFLILLIIVLMLLGFVLLNL